jgi:hypothetical protein
VTTAGVTNDDDDGYNYYSGSGGTDTTSKGPETVKGLSSKGESKGSGSNKDYVNTGDFNDDIDSGTASLREELEEYVAMGLVTIIPWPYIGCDGSNTVHDSSVIVPTEEERIRNNRDIKDNSFMNSGGSNSSTSSGGTCRRRLRTSVAPLRRTALLSCYNRFRGSSTWMALLGVDEFIGVDISKR